MRRACGFELKSEGSCLLNFAAYSDARGQDYVCRATLLTLSPCQDRCRLRWFNTGKWRAEVGER